MFFEAYLICVAGVWWFDYAKSHHMLLGDRILRALGCPFLVIPLLFMILVGFSLIGVELLNRKDAQWRGLGYVARITRGIEGGIDYFPNGSILAREDEEVDDANDSSTDEDLHSVAAAPPSVVVDVDDDVV